MKERQRSNAVIEQVTIFKNRCKCARSRNVMQKLQMPVDITDDLLPQLLHNLLGANKNSINAINIAYLRSKLSLAIQNR